MQRFELDTRPKQVHVALIAVIDRQGYTQLTQYTSWILSTSPVTGAQLT